MKILLKLLIIFTFLTNCAQAVTFDVLVLPSDLFSQKENYYGFDEPSEIFANDIIKNFNASNGKVKSPNLYEVRQKFQQNTQVKNALDKFKNTNKIDYAAFKAAGNETQCKSVLLISSSVVTNKNSLKRSIWEVLEISTAFEISYPYRLETAIVLLDVVNDIIMWSNSYSYKIGTNANIFEAGNYAQANAELEKIKLYSEKVLSSSATQNMMLRFFPKSIRPLEGKVDETSGDVLRFEKNLPEKPKELKPRENFYGDMIYGI